MCEHVEYKDKVYAYKPLDTKKDFLSYRYEQPGQIIEDYVRYKYNDPTSKLALRYEAYIDKAMRKMQEILKNTPVKADPTGDE